jgi:hypothetical protein
MFIFVCHFKFGWWIRKKCCSYTHIYMCGILWYTLIFLLVYHKLQSSSSTDNISMQIAGRVQHEEVWQHPVAECSWRVHPVPEEAVYRLQAKQQAPCGPGEAEIQFCLPLYFCCATNVSFVCVLDCVCHHAINISFVYLLVCVLPVCQTSLLSNRYWWTIHMWPCTFVMLFVY